MFRAVPCSSSGGQIVLLQPLVSTLSVNGHTIDSGQPYINVVLEKDGEDQLDRSCEK